MTIALAPRRGRKAFRSVVGVTLALAGLTCRDRPLTGPGIPQRAALVLAPSLAPSLAAAADAPTVRLERLRVLAFRLGLPGAVLDTTASFPAGDAPLSLDLDLVLTNESERFVLRLLGVVGTDTVYRAIDTATVVVRQPAVPRSIVMRYAGPDTIVASVEILPKDTIVSRGEAFRMRAVARRADGSVVNGAALRFVSRDGAALAMADDGRGTASALFSGVRVVVTTATGLQDSTLVTSRERVASIVLAPDSADVVRGEAVTLVPTLRDAFGNVLTGRTIAWSSARPAALSVDGAGVARGLLADSTVTVTASSEGASATARVRITRRPLATLGVTPAAPSIVVGNAVMLTAQGRDAAGAANDDHPVTFTSLDESTLTLTALPGSPKSVSVAGVRVGSAVVRATAGGLTTDVTVTVTPPAAAAVDRVVVSPATPSLAPGEAVALTATAQDASGATVSGVAFTWASSAPGVASVSSTGVVSALARGTATITATGGGKAGTSVVTVRNVATRMDAGADLTIGAIGGTATLAPQAFDVDGAPLPGTVFTFAALDPSIATVNGSGMVTAVANGTARVVAATGTGAGIVADTVQVLVQQRVAALTVAPDTLLLARGASATLTATAVDARGVPVTSFPVTWATRDASVATVTSAGVVTLHAGPYTRIVGTSDGVSDSAWVVKNPPDVPIETRLARIDVTPAAPVLRVGDTLTFRAEFVEASGARSTIAPMWSSTHPGRVAVSASGFATASDTGAAQATATDRGVTGRATITVLPAPIPTALSVLPGALAGSATAPVTATATVAAFDQGTGIASATFTLTSPSGAQSRSCTVSAHTTGNPRNGTWRCALTLPMGSETGAWRITSVVLAGSITRTYTAAMLAGRGLSAEVSVTP